MFPNALFLRKYIWKGEEIFDVYLKEGEEMGRSLEVLGYTRVIYYWDLLLIIYERKGGGRD